MHKFFSASQDSGVDCAGARALYVITTPNGGTSRLRQIADNPIPPSTIMTTPHTTQKYTH